MHEIGLRNKTIFLKPVNIIEFPLKTLILRPFFVSVISAGIAILRYVLKPGWHFIWSCRFTALYICLFLMSNILRVQKNSIYKIMSHFAFVCCSRNPVCRWEKENVSHQFCWGGCFLELPVTWFHRIISFQLGGLASGWLLNPCSFLQRYLAVGTRNLQWS